MPYDKKWHKKWHNNFIKGNVGNEIFRWGSDILIDRFTRWTQRGLLVYIDEPLYR